MPSPVIPRSSSEPYLSSRSNSSKTRLPASNRSVCSNRSSRSSSSWLQAWHNINKLGNFIISSERKSLQISKHNSDLTEECLEAHNRRHEQEAVVLVLDKNARCSPYYKGLTDASRIINRERNNITNSNNQTTLLVSSKLATSPGRESHATTSTSNSFSSFVLKMQDWGSCLSFKSTSTAISTTTSGGIISNSTKPSCPSNFSSSSSIFQSPSRVTELKRKEKTGIINFKEKPLRERVSSDESSLTRTRGPDQSFTDNGDNREINRDEATGDLGLMIGREFTWANKYQPKALSDFICNRDKATQLQALMREVDCSHYIFEGPTGVGKRTMIWAMLQEAFGPDRVKTREECKAFSLKGEPISSIKVRLKVSSQHVEVNLSDMKGYEKHIIVELIKETLNRISNKDLPLQHDNCQAIILYDADKLTTEALLYIKWLLERYKGFTKFFFCCSEVSKLQPIKTLCTIVQLFPPSRVEIVQVLEFIAKKEGIELPLQLAERIADDSKNNLSQAIRSFEASWRRSYPFTEDQVILSGWENDIANIAMNMIEEQSPKQLYVIRRKLQNLIEHDVSPDYIFDVGYNPALFLAFLLGELKNHLDEMFHLQIDNMHRHYKRVDGNWLDGENYRNRHEEDPARKKFNNFMRIEEYIAKFMSFYKRSVANNKDRG